MTSPPEARNQVIPEGGAEEGGRRFQFQASPTRKNPIPSQPSQPGSPPTQGRSRRQESPREKKAPPSDPAPPGGGTLRRRDAARPSFSEEGMVCNEVTRKRSRWRKNSVLSPSRSRKLARSRLSQPRPPNTPRNPCFFRPPIPGLRAEQSSPTATAASRRPRAATEPTKGPRRACRAGRAHSNSDADPPPDSPSTSSEPAPDTTSDSDSASASDPFGPLVSEPGHLAHPLFPARSLP
jgi:hypothetical protein